MAPRTFTFRFSARLVGADVRVFDWRTRTVVNTGAIGADGTYSVDLTPGSYYAVGQQGAFSESSGPDMYLFPSVPMEVPDYLSPVALADSFVSADLTAPGGRLSESGLSATYATRTGQDVRSADSLRTFRAALAARSVDVLVIGDSISEGTGPTLIEKRWQSRFRDDLRLRYGIVAGGRGYVPTNYGVTPAASDELWVPSGGAIDANSLTKGLGKRNYRLNATGHKVTLNVPVGHTDVDVLISVNPSETSWFKPIVDGVTGANVNAQAANTSGFERDTVFNVASGLDPATTHTVAIEWGVGNVWVSGAMLYKGDKTSGVRLWDGARHGQASAFFTGLTEQWWNTVNTIQPDLAVIAVGRNDWSSGVAVATYMANVQTIISGIRSQTTNDPSIVLLPVYGTAASGTPVAPWQDYVNALVEIAAADAGEVSVLDAYARMGTITDAASNALGITASDYVHPSNLGSQMIADALMDHVTAA